MNWQHFKAWNHDTTNNTTAYTEILVSAATASTTYISSPQINVYTDDPLTNTSATKTELGYILTSNATGQYVNSLKFTNIDGYNSLYIGKNDTSGNITITTANTEDSKKNSPLVILGPNGNLKKYNLFFGSNKTSLGDSTEVDLYAPTLKFYTEDLTNDSADPKFTLNTSATFTTDVTATYFNTTSDARAKTNLCEAHYSALDIVKNLKTYTYNYKNSNIQSYGILAQDIVDYSINGFSFIENAAATGVDGDYMKVKESKLVYLLLEAVKEQQKEIEDLKQQLKNK